MNGVPLASASFKVSKCESSSSQAEEEEFD